MKITTTLTETKRINRELEFMRKNKIRVGVLGEGANDVQEGGITIKQYAELNEYGTSNIPARPFFREATEFGESPSLISNRITSEIKKVINNNKTGEKAMQSIGLFVKGRIQRSIKAGNWTPNSPSTIKRKRKKVGIKPPLIETGSLIRAIDYEIKSR